MLFTASWITTSCQKQTKSAKSESKTKPSTTPTKQEPNRTKTPEKEAGDQDSGEKDWRTVGTFTGSGLENTPEFTISSEEWRVTIECGDANSRADFTGFLRHKGDDPEALEDLGQISGTGSEIVVRNFSGAGTYFVHMHGHDINWKITVEERPQQQFRFDR